MTTEPSQETFDRIAADLTNAEAILGPDSEAISRLKTQLLSLHMFEWPEDGHQRIAGIQEELADALSPDTQEESWPELEPLSEAEPVPTLTADLLPAALRPWLLDVAEPLSVPIEFIAIAAIVALGSCLGRSVAMYPKRYDKWQVVANLWGCVVAPSSSMKTPALDEGTRPLTRIASKAIATHEDGRLLREAEASLVEAKIARLTKSAHGSTPPATLASDLADAKEELEELHRPARRYITSDSTVEMLTELFRRNPRGLLVKRDELNGLLDTYDKSGREGDREFYLEAFNSAENYTVDRIGRGTIHVPALTLSIIGGFQPGKMDALMRRALRGGRDADGLLQRFQLTVYPERPSGYTHVDRPVDEASYEKVCQIFEHFAEFDTSDHPELEFLPDRLPGVRFDEEAQPVFDKWITAHINRLRSSELDATPAFQAHLGKYQGLVAKLALIFHFVENVESGTIPPVSLDVLDLAIRWVEFLEAHARKLYAAELRQVSENVEELTFRILNGDVQDGDSIRDVYRHGWKGLRTAALVTDAARLLTEKGWIRINKAAANGIGRPSDVIRVNPQLLEQEDDFYL